MLLPSLLYLGGVGVFHGRSAVSVQCSVRSGKKVKEVYRLFGRVCDHKWGDCDACKREDARIFRSVSLASFLLMLLVDRV